MIDNNLCGTDELHRLLDMAIGGDAAARDRLEGWLDAARPRPDVHQLAALVERTFQNDREGLDQLERWFGRVRGLLIQARQGRKDLEALAYLMTIRVASRKLEARYRGVQNDPASIASRVWERKLTAFLAGLEEGRFESVLQLIAWIGRASEFTIQNLIREARSQSRQAGPIEEDLSDFDRASSPMAGPASGDDERQQLEKERQDERRREDRRAVLRRVFGSLKGHHELFTIVVLSRFCKLGPEQVGEILAIPARTIHHRLAEAARIIGEAPPESLENS